MLCDSDISRFLRNTTHHRTWCVVLSNLLEVNMTQDTFLSGKLIRLRPLRLSDATLFTKWMNDEKIRPYLLRAFAITKEAEEDWIRENVKLLQFPTSVHFVMEVISGGQPIGVMGMHDINWLHRNCITGTVIGEKKCHGKGYATDAKLVLLRYAFETLGMHKVISHADARNAASIAYSKKCGYHVEGILKEDKWKDGAW